MQEAPPVPQQITPLNSPTDSPDEAKKKSVCSTEELRALVEPDHADISVRRQCELLGVNRSGLYYQPRGESAESLKPMQSIDEEYTRRPFYGSRRMMRRLHEQGYPVGRHRVRRLMELLGLQAVYPKPRLSQPGEGHKIYPYLLNEVAVTRVNQVWSTDITYIRMAGGFGYLVAVMDWFSRFVLSWALSLTLEADFCADALQRALRWGRPEIFNSDQGAQFTSDEFTGVLAQRGVAKRFVTRMISLHVRMSRGQRTPISGTRSAPLASTSLNFPASQPNDFERPRRSTSSCPILRAATSGSMFRMWTLLARSGLVLMTPIMSWPGPEPAFSMSRRRSSSIPPTIAGKVRSRANKRR